MPFIEELLRGVLELLRKRPELADELRSAFAAPRVAPTPPKAFASVAEYAEHVGYSKRTIETLIRRGLPISGSGRLRRVPVVEADQWLREGGTDKVTARRARLDARRSAVARLLSSGGSGNGS